MASMASNFEVQNNAEDALERMRPVERWDLGPGAVGFLSI